MKYALIIIFSIFFTLTAFSQKCDRPDQVFIQLTSLEKSEVTNILKKRDTRIYLQDSTGEFNRTSEIKKITDDEYAQLKFQTTKELREEERWIIRCEINRSDDGTVYLDADINSVFKNIYMVIKDGEELYQFRVHWNDWIE